MQSEVAFIAERDATADYADYAALSERRAEALTVHWFNLPATLRVTRQSTNAIEIARATGKSKLTM